MHQIDPNRERAMAVFIASQFLSNNRNVEQRILGFLGFNILKSLVVLISLGLEILKISKFRRV